MSLSTLSNDKLYKEIQDMQKRIRVLEGYLSGVPISNARIQSLTWDKARGGQAILGGLDNVNGELIVRDAANDDKVILDVDGITIRDGQLLIENQNGQISFDEKGVRSSTNFTIAGVAAGSLNQSITSPSGTTITGSTLTFTLDRSTNILFLVTVSGNMVESVGNTGNGYVFLEINGVEATFSGRVLFGSGLNELSTGASHYLALNLPAGSYTIRLIGVQDDLSGSSASLTIYNYQLSYARLGT